MSRVDVREPAGVFLTGFTKGQFRSLMTSGLILIIAITSLVPEIVTVLPDAFDLTVTGWNGAPALTGLGGGVQVADMV